VMRRRRAAMGFEFFSRGDADAEVASWPGDSFWVFYTRTTWDERFCTRTPGNCQCLRRMRVWICKPSSYNFSVFLRYKYDYF
jgi:hypothetical protein